MEKNANKIVSYVKKVDFWPNPHEIYVCHGNVKKHGHTIDLSKLVPIMNEKKAAFEPSGPSGRSFSRLLQHGATRRNSAPPGCNASPSQGYPQHYVRRYQFIHLGGGRHCKSKVSCPRIQQNVPGQGSNPDRSLRSRAH